MSIPFRETPTMTTLLDPTLDQTISRAVSDQRLTASAATNLREWLTQPRYQEFVPEIQSRISSGSWQELDDAFWTVIPFGTGGRRGKMYPVGCNAINVRTIGESAQGLADYVREHIAPPHACAIAYDTRHRSELFARLCAEIMVAAGFRVFFLYPFRSTPQLSFSIRHFGCQCGIMVTASHNPPSDNAVKVYWSNGCQILPPHDRGIIERVMRVDTIHRAPFDDAVAARKIEVCTEASDRAFLAAIARQAIPGPRDARILYSPLHGVGGTAVVPALDADRFQSLKVYAPHATPDGDFPNVPGHVSNPENAEVFTSIIQQAREERQDVILATDPDCDRLGCAAPVGIDASGAWKTFNGNQIGVLLTEFVLRKKKAQGRLGPNAYVVKTLVTTDMIRKIAEDYAVRCFGDLHVGFKWIGGLIDEQGPEDFVIGAEESHGYLVGDHARDKDAAVAAMLMAELTAELKAQGTSLHSHLAALYLRYGFHAERLVDLRMPGSQGMARMRELMDGLRTAPPWTLADRPVEALRDFLHRRESRPSGEVKPLDTTPGDMVVLDFAEPGNRVAIRPSGTEPKVKFYLFAALPVRDNSALEAAEAETNQWFAKLTAALRGLIE